MADNVEIPNNSPEFHSWASVDGSCSWIVEQNWTYHKAYDWILNVAESISIMETAGLMGILPEGVQKVLMKAIDVLKSKSEK